MGVAATEPEATKARRRRQSSGPMGGAKARRRRQSSGPMGGAKARRRRQSSGPMGGAATHCFADACARAVDLLARTHARPPARELATCLNLFGVIRLYCCMRSSARPPRPPRPPLRAY